MIVSPANLDLLWLFQHIIAVVAIDFDCLWRLLVTLSDTEALHKMLATGVTIKFRLIQLDHSGYIAIWW